MQMHHYLMLFLLILAGYALGRYFPDIGHKVGLP